MALRRLVPTALLAAAALGGTGVPAYAAPGDTRAQTIADRDGDGRLEAAPGEPLVVREDLATRPGTAAQTSLLRFVQLTDTHIIDEESPLRVELTDRFGFIFTSAYRPQEGLSPQVVDAMAQSVRSAKGPLSGADVGFVMTTGDNTDNTQCNETRWMIDVLDGGRVDPDSGEDRPRPHAPAELCLPADGPTAAPVPSACETAGNGTRYDGVRGSREYYEPDGPGAGADGPGYSPADGVRDFPGLFEAMNEPFLARGLGMPWYGIFGNHDGLLQGNQPRNPAFEAFGVGCAKVRKLPTQPASPDQVLPRLLEAPADAVGQIPADQRRRPLRKSEYIAEHFRTSGAPRGHGFTAENVAKETGYYSFSPAAGFRFLVLDTVADHGLEHGNIDDTQFKWIHAQLTEAAAAGQRVLLFAHHSLRTMGQPPVSPFVPGDWTTRPAELDPNVHFGIGLRESGTTMPCRTGDAAAATYPGESLRCLLLRHPAAIAFVNGHEHSNRIDPFRARSGQPTEGPGRFWEINTASHIDWPQQSRVLEIAANPGGTLSIGTAVIDHAGDLDPDAAITGAPGDARQLQLAGISRELSFNEPHADGAARGRPSDRNVELVVPDPVAASATTAKAGVRRR